MFKANEDAAKGGMVEGLLPTGEFVCCVSSCQYDADDELFVVEFTCLLGEHAGKTRKAWLRTAERSRWVVWAVVKANRKSAKLPEVFDWDESNGSDILKAFRSGPLVIGVKERTYQGKEITEVDAYKYRPVHPAEADALRKLFGKSMLPPLPGAKAQHEETDVFDDDDVPF